jgi:heme iron utilization protein
MSTFSFRRLVIEGALVDPMSTSEPPIDGLLPGTLARRLMREADRATLATRRVDGWPFASLVEVATDHDGSPLLLLSELAEHTKNIRVEARVSLLFDGTVGLAEPLTGPRLSVLGTIQPSQDEVHRRRFATRHPGARAYAGFGDFHHWHVSIEKAHLVAGFGRIRWLAREEVLVSGDATLLARHAMDIVDHMNLDHGDAIDLYARVLLGRPGQGWRMADVDPDGCDLRLNQCTARLNFESLSFALNDVRNQLVNLVARARAQDREPTF